MKSAPSRPSRHLLYIGRKPDHDRPHCEEKARILMDFSALVGHQDMLPPGSPDVARLRANAIPLLTQIDARENLRTQKVLPLAAGMWNALYRLEPGGVIAKLSSGDNSFEVNFLRAAATLDIPVPQVFGSGLLQHPALPTATYFLMSYIADSANAWPLIHTENAMTVAEIQQLAHDLGQAMAKLHQVSLGYITHFGTKVDTWKQALTDTFSPDWDGIAPNTLFDDKLLPILKRVLEKTDYFAFRDGSLIHADLNLSNVLVDRTTHRLRAIIDPAGYAGMPMYDLAYAAMPWDHGFDFFRAIIDSYRQHGGQFVSALFYTSILVVAYRHSRFHTPAVSESIFRDILPHIGV